MLALSFLAILLFVMVWNTHRDFSRLTFWLVFGAVIALNGFFYAADWSGFILLIVDLPGVFVMGPLGSLEPPPLIAHGLVALFLAISASVWGYIAGRVVGALGARRLKVRRPIGVCSTCGYDLTGNVSGVCPECGTAANADHE